ncbi:MAG: YraN family protein [Clostridia bacterium]
MDRYALGVVGEQMAVEYLVKKGYEIIDRNINYPNVGELDIIAKDGQTLVFVEVRTRADNSFGHPLETFTKVKQQKVVKASRRYILENKPNCDAYRFDAVAIISEQIIHIPNAFLARWN